MLKIRKVTSRRLLLPTMSAIWAVYLAFHGVAAFTTQSHALHAFVAGLLLLTPPLLYVLGRRRSR
jgi:hypothetical protein